MHKLYGTVAEGMVMAQLFDYLEYLSKDIGARPGGTEEEQAASLYITEHFQKDAEFPAVIENFTSSSNVEGLRAVCAAVAVLSTLLAMFLPILSIPAFVLTLVAAAVYILEAYSTPFVSRALARGASQNVVAKYQPNVDQSGRARARKVVLVARYDTGRSKPEILSRIEELNIPLGPICAGGMGALALLALLRMVLFSSATGMALIVFNILSVLAMLVAALPLVKAIACRVSPYNEGANNNASGVAALIEVARRISRDSVSEADLQASAHDVVVHGEEEAYEANLVPEGARLVYEASQLLPPDIEPQSPEARLLSAKAALAAFTGQAPSTWVPTDVADKLVGSKATPGGRAIEMVPAQPAEPLPEDGAGEFVGNDWATGKIQPIAEADIAAANDAADQNATAAPAEEIVAAAQEATEVPVEPEETAEQAIPAIAVSVAAEAQSNLPDWFVSAQQKAKRSEENTTVRRSRYADALEAVEREQAAREEELARQREQEARERDQAAREKALQALRESQAAVTVPAIEPVEEPAAEEALEAAPVAPQLADAEMVEPEAYVAPDQPEGAVAVEEDAEPAPYDEPTIADMAEGFDFEEVADEPDEEAIPEPPAARRRPIVLPNIAESQPAVADAEQPQIAPVEEPAPSRSGMIRKLRTDIPSLSGVIREQEAGEEAEYNQVNVVGGTVDTSMDAAFAEPARPIADDEDIYESYATGGSAGGVIPEDALYGTAQNAAVSEQPAEPADEGYGYEEDEGFYEPAPRPVRERVEKPKKRGFFGFFRKDKGEELSESPQEWLGVDEEFDPRAVGRERGGWESFRDENVGAPGENRAARPARNDAAAYDDQYEDFDEFGYEDDQQGGRRWNGGAFSRARMDGADEPVDDEMYDDDPYAALTSSDARSVTGEIGRLPVNESRVSVDLYAPEEEPEVDELAAEMESIYHFRNPNYNTEIWFVAVGSELDSHDGTRAFIETHKAELRGAMIVEIESLGGGRLSVVQEEGLFKKVKASSRAKRYTKKANLSTGFTLADAVIPNADSIASIAQKEGVQAMHIAGMDGNRPAGSASKDDVLENVNYDLLEDNVDYLMELLKGF